MTKHNQIDMAIPEARADAPASFIVYPVPPQRSVFGKIGAFALGFVTGVAAVAMASVIANDLDVDAHGNADAGDLSKFNVIDIDNLKNG